MREATRILVAVVLTLAAFAAVMCAFVYAIFHFSLGYMRSDLFGFAAAVLFICTTFLVNIAWQAPCNRFSRIVQADPLPSHRKK
jgi:hypothetical protein